MADERDLFAVAVSRRPLRKSEKIILERAGCEIHPVRVPTSEGEWRADLILLPPLSEDEMSEVLPVIRRACYALLDPFEAAGWIEALIEISRRWAERPRRLEAFALGGWRPARRRPDGRLEIELLGGWIPVEGPVPVREVFADEDV